MTKRGRRDHGTAQDAIDFVLDGPGKRDSNTERLAFLEAWREGALGEWPDYYEWLKSRPK